MLLHRLEQLLAKQPPPLFAGLPTSANALQTGDTVIIVGGGIAGSSMARYLLKLCRLENKEIHIFLVNSTNCNYCGGLVTDLALKTFSAHYDLKVEPEQVLSHIKECIYVNSHGSFPVEISVPLISTLRTSKFGLIGFDDSIKEKITQGLQEQAHLLTIIEPTLVREIIPISDQNESTDSKENWEVTLSRKVNDKNVKLTCRALVLANGLRGINRPLITHFGEHTSYKPPRTMAASVTEIDTSQAVYNNLQGKVFMLDGIVPNCIAALVCKGKHWVTVTALNKKLEFNDIETIFAHPQVKQHIDLPNPTAHLRCGIICGATVFTHGANNFFGDNWVSIGDLTGTGRVLKDGYFAALVSAKYAAETLMYHGLTKKDFARHYARPLKKATAAGNNIGMLLFFLNLKLIKYKFFNKLLIFVGQAEKRKGQMGGGVHTAIRALTTGELSYYVVTWLFIWGFISYFIGYFPKKIVAKYTNVHN